MHLQTHIQSNLWLAIRSTYEAKNYSHAILDAIHYLSNVLREKTGVDGDGATLVGQALGGESPKLRINKFQTETERNEQKGIENLLRGLYQAIRNPRSHEQIDDKQETADAIIYFVDYLLGVIERSEEPFVVSKFLESVFDPDFYRSQQYAELLINRIPANKRFDVLVLIYREKFRGDIYNVALVIKALINQLTDEQTQQFVAIVSDELATTIDEKGFRYILHLLPPELWQQLNEVSRLRAENRVIKELKDGRGALSTWARDHFQYFKLKQQLGNVFLEKLQGRSSAEKLSVVKNYLSQLPYIFVDSRSANKCVQAISHSIKNGNIAVRNALVDDIFWLPEEWQNYFVESLKDLIDSEENSGKGTYLPNGTYFIGTLELPQDDDMPF
jgi:uncharacterized protein (TIGR02391 family)